MSQLKHIHLITGATGFVGGRLARRLVDRGEAVRALVRATSRTDGLIASGVELVVGDLTDPASIRAACEGVTHIYHVGEVGMSVPGADRLNVQAVRALAKGAALQPAFRRFVFLSSLTVGAVPAELPADEDTPADPERMVRDHYTNYKRACEERLRESGVPASVVRGGGIYGPGAEYLAGFVRACRKVPFPIPFPGRLAIRLATVHVADLASILDAAGGYAGERFCVFNAVDDAAGSVGEFLARLCAEAGAPVRFWSPPLVLQRAGAFLLDPLLGMKMPGHNVEGIVRYMGFDQHFSNRRIKDELGVGLDYPDWERGITETANWLRGRL